MFQKRCFKSIFRWSLGLTLLLIILFVSVSNVSAQSIDNPTSCKFQPPTQDRSPTLNSIILIEPGGPNFTWDNTYIGLHRWPLMTDPTVSIQWPGVDYLVPTTVIFQNGGYVKWLGYDGAGGGYSISIDGFGECSGWTEFIGHLDYDPTTRYEVGQFIGPDEIIGLPGCAGFKNSCTSNGGYILPHNHTALGFHSNIFNFEDGTTADYIDGYWWIHPSRVEGFAQTTPSNSKLNFSIGDNSKEFPQDYSPPNRTAIIKISMPEMVKNIIAQNRIFLLIIVALLGLAFFGKLIYSGDFRRLSVYGVISGIIIAISLVGVTQVLSKNLQEAPPRSVQAQSSYNFVVMSQKDSSIEINGECNLPSSYSSSVLQWCTYIQKYAELEGLPPRLVAAVMTQESAGNPSAYSASGATGLLQVMPRDGIAQKFQCVNGPCFADRPTINELTDPEFNISYGTHMLGNLYRRTGSFREALFQYGPMDVGYHYADIVLSIYENYQ